MINRKLSKNNKLQNEINNYLNTINELNLKIKKLESDINSKNIEIENLNNKLEDSLFNLENCKPGEKIMALQIISIDEKVSLPIPCKNTTTFVKIEEELYKEYPEYKDVNTYFTVNGFEIKRFKSIQENNIKNRDKIILNIYE